MATWLTSLSRGPNHPATLRSLDLSLLLGPLLLSPQKARACCRRARLQGRYLAAGCHLLVDQSFEPSLRVGSRWKGAALFRIRLVRWITLEKPHLGRSQRGLPPAACPSIGGQNSKQSPLRTCVNEGGLPGVQPGAGPRSAPVAGSLGCHGLISASGQSDGGMSRRGASPQSASSCPRSAPSTFASKLMSER